MSRRLTADPLPKKVPVRFDSGSSITKLEDADQIQKGKRPECRILPNYIDDQACVFTRYLLPDTYGCPRFRFSKSKENEPKSQKDEEKNPLIDSYYPTVDCDCSEEQESQKTYSELQSIKKSKNRKNFNNSNVRNLKWTPKPPFDCRTFTIYSCKSNSSTVPEVDNPRPEGQVDLEKSCETSSGLECFSELHKRIANLEEKLQHTLEKSIEINGRKRRKSGSVQKLFRMVSGVLERSGKPKVKKASDLDKSDSEDDLRNIKKRLQDLETKLKREKNYAGRNHLDLSSNSLLLKEGEDVKPCGISISKIVTKESDYTEPLQSDSELYSPREYQLKNKKDIAGDGKAKQVKPQFLLRSKRKRNFRKNIPKRSNENESTEKECVDKELVLVKFNYFKHHSEKNPEPERTRKFKKKRRKKSRNLCKKNSKTNILKEESRNANENGTKEEPMRPWTAHEKKYWEPCSCPECPFRVLSSSLALPPEIINSIFRPRYKESKPEKGETSFFFKPRQNIKMPILFEEVNTMPKFLDAGRKTSKVSMRLILPQGKKNLLVTLRKLIKKLSQTHSFEDKNQ